MNLVLNLITSIKTYTKNKNGTIITESFKACQKICNASSIIPPINLQTYYITKKHIIKALNNGFL